MSERLSARIEELEAQLADARRMYELVASKRTVTLVKEFQARAESAEARLAEATIRKAELEGLVNVASQQIEECATSLRLIARERDKAKAQLAEAKRYNAELYEGLKLRDGQWATAEARAESAEAERDKLRAALEAILKWDAGKDAEFSHVIPLELFSAAKAALSSDARQESEGQHG